MHEHDPKYPAGCPACQEPLETKEHLYRCPAPSRSQWRSQSIIDFRKHLQKENTKLELEVLLLEGWSAVINDRSFSDMDAPVSVEHVAQAQTRIGWDQLLKGRLSISWSQSQQQHLGAFDGKKNGVTWATSVSKWMLLSWLELWNIRNGARHGKDRATRTEAIRQQVIREVELAYSKYKDQVQPRHDFILETPLEQKKQHRTSALKMWLGWAVPVLEESYKERLATG